MTPSRGKEHDACDTIWIYKDTINKDAKEFHDPIASVHARALQELKIAERVSAYNAADMDKIVRVDEREEERRKWTAYDHNVLIYGSGVSKALYSNGNNLY